MLSSISAPIQVTLMRVGAVLAVLAAAATFASGVMHPAESPPDDHTRIFDEYSDSELWLPGHLLQTYGFFCMFSSVLAVAYVLASRDARGQVAARFAFPLAVAAMAVAAVLQGLDTVTLKAVSDKWVAASAAERAAAFAAAETVRFLEIGFNSVFRMLQGFCFTLLGAALATRADWARWLGWCGCAIGAAIVLRGFAVAFTGFSLSNPFYGTVGGTALHLLNVWLLVLAFHLWREAKLVRSAS